MLLFLFKSYRTKVIQVLKGWFTKAWTENKSKTILKESIGFDSEFNKLLKDTKEGSSERLIAAIKESVVGEETVDGLSVSGEKHKCKLQNYSEPLNEIGIKLPGLRLGLHKDVGMAVALYLFMFDKIDSAIKELLPNVDKEVSKLEKKYSWTKMCFIEKDDGKVVSGIKTKQMEKELKSILRPNRRIK